MTSEIAIRLKPIFKRDFKKARFKCACINGNGKYWNNHDPVLIRRYDRLAILFEITKELYIECLEALGERTH